MTRIQRGFTLIELLIVVVIVAILAGIAVPSYRSYVVRSQRADAKATLLALSTAQEKFYLQCNRYAAALGASSNCAGTGTVAFNSTSHKGWYDMAVAAATNTDFTLTATAKNSGPQYKDTDCRVFQVTDRGVRTARNSSDADSTSTCW